MEPEPIKPDLIPQTSEVRRQLAERSVEVARLRRLLRLAVRRDKDNQAFTVASGEKS
jgi:hypothetical protein